MIEGSDPVELNDLGTDAVTSRVGVAGAIVGVGAGNGGVAVSTGSATAVSESCTSSIGSPVRGSITGAPELSASRLCARSWR